MKAAYDAAGYNELHQPVPTPLREATHRHSVVTHPHTTTPLDHTVAHPAQSAATKRDEDTNTGKEKQTPQRHIQRALSLGRGPAAQRRQDRQDKPAHTTPLSTLWRRHSIRHDAEREQHTHTTRGNLTSELTAAAHQTNTAELTTAARQTSPGDELAPGEVTEFRSWEAFTDIGIVKKRLASSTPSRKKRARVGHKILIAEADGGLSDDREEWYWTDLGRRPHESYKWLYYSGKHKGRRPPPAPLRGGTGGNPSGASVFQHSLGVSAPT